MDIKLDSLNLYVLNEIKASQNKIRFLFPGSKITYSLVQGKWLFAENELILDALTTRSFRFHYIPNDGKKPPTTVNLIISDNKPKFMFLHDFYDNKAIERTNKFASILRANDIEWVRCWTNPLATYGTHLLWKQLGFKVHLTMSFSDNLVNINSKNNSPSEFKAQFNSILQRIGNCDVVQFWNEPQFKHYTPRDVDNEAGFKLVFDNYVVPLSKALGKGRIASPSFTPHFGAETIVPRLAKAGFFDSSVCSLVDIHPYWYPGAKANEITSKFDLIRKYTNLPLTSSEFNINLNAMKDDNYIVKYLEPQLGVYANYFGSNPMAYFIGTQSSRHPNYAGIWDMDGKLINPKILELLRKFQS